MKQNTIKKRFSSLNNSKKPSCANVPAWGFHQDKKSIKENNKKRKEKEKKKKKKEKRDMTFKSFRDSVSSP